MPRLFVVLSGLLAAGKTTLGRPLSVALGLPLLDTDEILESLFDSLGCSTPEDRRRLSRASDSVLQNIAAASQGAVLSSFWRRESLSTTSGSPTAWLSELPAAAVVEVLCECPPTTAATRYAQRQRHPAHHDTTKSAADLERQFQALAAAGPLRLGPLLKIDTGRHMDADAVAQAVREAASQISPRR